MWHSGLSEEIQELFTDLEGCWDRKDTECHLRIVSEKNARLSGRPLGRPPQAFGKKADRGFELLKLGHSQAEVARMLNVNRTTVRRWQRAS